MKCDCGKEVGLRLWCEDCTQKHINEIVSIQDCIKKANKRFKEGLETLQLRKHLNLDGYTFTKIVEKHSLLGSIHKDTTEQVFEWEFYTILKTLLEVLEAFESGRRTALKTPDYNELLGTLEYNYKLLKNNIGWLEKSQKEGN